MAAIDVGVDSLATHANLVLQINRSHLERTERFLRARYRAVDAAPGEVGGDGGAAGGPSSAVVDVVATRKSTASKTCSLVFLRVADERAFVEDVTGRCRFVLQGLNKMYVMTGERSIMRGSFATEGENDMLNGERSAECAIHYLLNVLRKLQCDNRNATGSDSKDREEPLPIEKYVPVKARIDVFPMALQRRVVGGLTALMGAKAIPESELDITPAGQTHTLSVVQIDTGSYLVGVASVDRSAPRIRNVNMSNNICRAFHKLSEAFERYADGGAPLLLTSKGASGSKEKEGSTKTVVAVDCGAAPGGWTRYLLEQTACDEVYAVDPGEMDTSLSSLPNVHHLKKTAAEAIPELQRILAREESAVALWASDMCLHDMPKQVDMFLRAHSEGILRPGAAFVLTIKCNVGHGSECFDMFAEGEANRLARAAGTSDISVLHLFSNRVGERTIVGRLAARAELKRRKDRA